MLSLTNLMSDYRDDMSQTLLKLHSERMSGNGHRQHQGNCQLAAIGVLTGQERGP